MLAVLIWGANLGSGHRVCKPSFTVVAADRVGQEFPAPRAEFTPPLRGRCPTMTGALAVVDTMPGNAFSPLTLFYPYPHPVRVPVDCRLPR